MGLQNKDVICYRFKLNGGFGNQLFQMATAASLSLRDDAYIQFAFKDHKREFVLSQLGLELEKVYRVHLSKSRGLEFESVCRKPKKLWRTLTETSYTFSPLAQKRKSANIKGYFQSPRYFSRYESNIRCFLRENLKIDSYEDKEVGNVSRDLLMHVRLGDNVYDPRSVRTHGTLSVDYLRAALDFGWEYERVIVVTDSPAEFKLLYRDFSPSVHHVISRDLVSDFILLAKASQLVIANSTFSWWAGYVSHAKVIAPINWVTSTASSRVSIADLYPPNWIIL